MAHLKGKLEENPPPQKKQRTRTHEEQIRSAFPSPEGTGGSQLSCADCRSRRAQANNVHFLGNTGMEMAATAQFAVMSSRLYSSFIMQHGSLKHLCGGNNFSTASTESVHIYVWVRTRHLLIEGIYDVEKSIFSNSQCVLMTCDSMSHVFRRELNQILWPVTESSLLIKSEVSQLLPVTWNSSLILSFWRVRQSIIWSHVVQIHSDQLIHSSHSIGCCCCAGSLLPVEQRWLLPLVVRLSRCGWRYFKNSRVKGLENVVFWV